MRKLCGTPAVWAAVLVAGLLAGAAAAGEEPGPDAEDLLPRIDALADAVEQHDKADDLGALQQDAASALEIYRLCTEKQDKERKRTMDVLRTVLKCTREDAVVQAALRAIGGTSDAAAPGLVRPYLRQRDLEEGDPVLTTAIEVAGDMPDGSFVPPLLKIVERSKHYATAAQAMAALGHYGKDKRNRVRILESLVKTVAKCQPGGPPRTSRGGSQPGLDPSDPMTGAPMGKDTGPGARWSVLSLAITPALNELTNRKIENVYSWLDLYDQYKKNLEVLFDDE